jgi:hypothetical protein
MTKATDCGGIRSGHSAVLGLEKGAELACKTLAERSRADPLLHTQAARQGYLGNSDVGLCAQRTSALTRHLQRPKFVILFWDGTARDGDDREL